MSTLLPLVSIGTPVYNGEDFIRQAIESVINQDYPNIEMVISDNASIDNTQSICEEYASKYSQIKYHRQSINHGMIANFNASFELAQGKFFCWLSHDDFLSPTYISKCMSMLDLYPQAIACCSEINFVNYDGTNREGWTKAYSNFDALNKDVVERVRELTSKVGWYALYSLFRTDILRKVGTCYSRYPDDVLLMLEWLLLGEIVKISEYLYNYRVPDVNKTPEDYIRAFGLDADTSAEVRKGSFTFTAKQIVDTVYASDISTQDKHRIKADFVKTLTYHNQDWLGRIIREQNWISKTLTPINIQQLLESTIISSQVAKFIEQNPPLKSTKTLVFFPHNPCPASTGAHRRCLEMLAGLRNLGCEIILFSSDLYADQLWTQKNINFLKVEYGINVFIYQATKNDLRYIKMCHAQFQTGRINWDYFNAPGLTNSFKQIFRQFKPNLVMVNYSLWGRLVSGKEFESVVKVIDTHDIVTLSMQMSQILTPHFSQQSIEPSAIAPEITKEDLFTNLNLQPEQEEFNICDLYDYTIAISQKEGALFAAHTQRTENLYVPITVDVPQIINTYTESPLFVISGNCFNLQGATYFIKKVLPLISESIPDFKLRVIGAGGTRLTTTPELDICGFVEDLSPLYTQSGFAICPLIGGTGQQVKIVEAMAHGLAVVALKNVAETSPIEHGINGFIANNAEEFSRYTIALWKDRSLCQEMGEAARQTIKQQFSSLVMTEKIKHIVSRASQAGTFDGADIANLNLADLQRNSQLQIYVFQTLRFIQVLILEKIRILKIKIFSYLQKK
jgi:glycosyltransferase involved in cell wall biosynthesis